MYFLSIFFVFIKFKVSIINSKTLVKFHENYRLLGNISQLKIRKIANLIFNKNNMVVCYDGEKQLNKEITRIMEKL